jgi:hypothetical protein
MLDALVNTGITVPSLAMLTPRTIAQPPPPVSGPREDALPAPTRVSWTTGEPRSSALSGATTEAMQARSSRAQIMRKRGLFALGAAVMLAAFILTTGFLRARKSAHAPTPPSKATTVAASGSAPPAAAASVAEPAEADVRAAADVTSPGARIPAVAPPSKGKRPPPSAPFSVAASPAIASPSPSAAPAKTSGVAGGLQIKTNYP